VVFDVVGNDELEARRALQNNVESESKIEETQISQHSQKDLLRHLGHPANIHTYSSHTLYNRKGSHLHIRHS
jgi:hypothetical protein